MDQFSNDTYVYIYEKFLVHFLNWWQHSGFLLLFEGFSFAYFVLDLGFHGYAHIFRGHVIFPSHWQN